MNWVYKYEKYIYISIRENKFPEKFLCPLSFKGVTKDICHSVDTCLECHNEYYPGGRGFCLLWLPPVKKLIPMPDKNQGIDTMIARRKHEGGASCGQFIFCYPPR